ncbi:hypothetical protein [Nevskia sp.]|uniref:hypothetical protein n=1 Tax=Nevskia sp. TaxID=1929292 RepID=UPI00260106F2|nr:hypothetical protein [Nevskia sp.]
MGTSESFAPAAKIEALRLVKEEQAFWDEGRWVVYELPKGPLRDVLLDQCADRYEALNRIVRLLEV